jgi:diguanylate cyclase (GGDEF)-like protein
VLRAARGDSFVEWVQDGTSCFTVGSPAAPAAANLADLRTAGVEAIVGVGLFAHGELLGVLVLASGEPALVDTDDVEVLEQLATHAAACLRTAELLGSLRTRAASDPLTGPGHHATFHEPLAASHRRPTTAVVVCDIDGFKRLNDTYGHGHGDRVLCGIADAMSGALRRGDRLFRIGGDEFAALLAVDSKAEALGAASRLREAVNEARLGVTVSIGVAVPHADESDASLLARADRALYTVKAGGRDGVALANDEPLPATPAIG